MHTPRRAKSPASVVGSTSPDEGSNTQSSKTEKIIEDRSHTYSMDRERRATVCGVKVDGNTVTGSTVAKTIVIRPKNATVFKNTVSKSNSIKFAAVSQLEPVDVTEKYKKVLCPVMMQRKMASCREEAITLSK